MIPYFFFEKEGLKNCQTAHTSKRGAKQRDETSGNSDLLHIYFLSTEYQS